MTRHRPVRLATASEIVTLATITEADVLRAQEAWDKDAPPAFKTLLDATLVPSIETEPA
jgi:hypothetical protein